MKMCLINNKKIVCIVFVLLLVTGIVYILFKSQKSNFDIDSNEVGRIDILSYTDLIGDYKYTIGEKREIKKVIKSLNKVACYSTEDPIGEPSPSMLVEIYGWNNKLVYQIYFYGGMSSIDYYKDDIRTGAVTYETGIFTNIRLRRLCKSLK